MSHPTYRCASCLIVTIDCDVLKRKMEELEEKTRTNSREREGRRNLFGHFIPVLSLSICSFFFSYYNFIKQK